MTLIRNSIKDQVYLEIRNRIFDRTLLPGSTLNITHLSKELGVSNSPIREALAVLETEGLVLSEANSKFKVVSLDSQLIDALNHAILVILCGAMDQCAKEGRMEELRDALEKTLEHQKAVTDQTPQEQIYQLAISFDREFVNVAGNRFLMDAFNRWANLLYMSTALMRTGSENSIQEHQDILQAVAAGDLQEAKHRLEIHYDKHIED